MLSIFVVDDAKAFTTTHMHMWECMLDYMWLIVATVVFAHEGAREKGGNVESELSGFWSFHCQCGAPPVESGVHGLDGEQATKSEVLDHRELLQTLEMGEEKGTLMK